MIQTRLPEQSLVNEDTPLRRLTIGDVVVGDSVRQTVVFDSKARQAFEQLANDRAPLHEDERFAHEHGFDGPIIQGLCVSTRFSRLIGMYLPGEHAILESINLKFRHPTYENQPLVLTARVERILPPLRVLRLSLMATCAGVVHITGEAQCLVR